MQKNITIIILLAFLIMENLTAQYYVSVNNDEILGWYHSYDECYKACNLTMNTAPLAKYWNGDYGGQITGQISSRTGTLQLCKCREAKEEEIEEYFGTMQEDSKVPQSDSDSTYSNYQGRKINTEKLVQTYTNMARGATAAHFGGSDDVYTNTTNNGDGDGTGDVESEQWNKQQGLGADIGNFAGGASPRVKKATKKESLVKEVMTTSPKPEPIDE